MANFESRFFVLFWLLAEIASLLPGPIFRSSSMRASSPTSMRRNKNNNNNDGIDDDDDQCSELPQLRRTPSKTRRLLNRVVSCRARNREPVVSPSSQSTVRRTSSQPAPAETQTPDASDVDAIGLFHYTPIVVAYFLSDAWSLESPQLMLFMHFGGTTKCALIQFWFLI